jgi:hypothetical protein
MIKVYLDWNVMAQIKDGNHQELKDILIDNKKLLKPYSTSHISDILSSFKDDEKQKELINQDLEFISKLTNNAFLFNDGKNIILDFALPTEYYQQRLDERDLYKDISIDGLFGRYENDELMGGLMKPYLNLLKQIPLDNIFKETFENPEASQQIETLFPGLKENPTMDGFFKAFGEMYRNLNEDDKYKDLRKIVQSGLGINRDKIFDSNNPYEILQDKYKQISNSNIQSSANDKHAPEWFNEITNEYIRLDMHGYQEDKVNVTKGRKETFKNTTEDAFHAAFASTCNFYVINDKKSYKKTKQVFEKLQINTLVLKPDEFVKYYDDYLDFEDPGLNINIPFALLQNGEYTEQQLEDAILRIYYFPFFLFGFFTKLMLLLPENEEPPILLLSRTKPTNGTTYIMEITRLANEISSLFGEDIQELGEVKEEEFAETNWVGRNWKLGNLNLRLVSTNGHFQLYIKQEESEQAI